MNLKRLWSVLVWLGVAGLGAGAYAGLAWKRAEPLNSSYLLVAALCTYALGYRFYSKWVAARALMLNDRRATPCEVHDDGRDFVRTNPWIVFGHHFAAISGPGPLVGPVLAAQFGYLPGTLWILIGCVLGGAVQDLVILFCSMRRDGRGLGQMFRAELNTAAGYVSLLAIVAILLILLAVLALVVVKALGESPWGVFTVGATIPIAMFMGGYMRWWRIGRVLEASTIGVVLLLLAVWGGQYVYGHPEWRRVFSLHEETVAWAVIAYALAASVLPVWLLLAPRDYLSTFMKLGTIAALVLGVFVVLPDLKMPALTQFVDGSGLVVTGKIFPFCFITIACGAISGFHSLIASGTTPKLITRERYARPVGYGAMCLESLVAVMAMVAACTLEPGVYLSMNVKGPGETPAQVATNTLAKVNASGFPVSLEQMDRLARQVGEPSLIGRTGGAPTLAVGMAQVFSQMFQGRFMDLWYHFAIMFEALFILTTLDAGTRVGRYILQDALGHLWRPLGDTKSIAANVLASSLMVSGWGYFLIMGVRDPEGGVRALWALFGIANQMLAAIALCLPTTVLLKMHLCRPAQAAGAVGPTKLKPQLALITLLPLCWLLVVTLTAGWQKLFHFEPNAGRPRVSFLQAAADLGKPRPFIEANLVSAQARGDAQAIAAAQKALAENRTKYRNNMVDAVAVAVFLSLILAIVALCARDWCLLLSRRREPVLREAEAVWLPEPLAGSSKAATGWGLLTVTLALLRELSGEAEFDRARQAPVACGCPSHREDGEGQLFAKVTRERYASIRRCC